jgi:hypothetical protein
MITNGNNWKKTVMGNLYRMQGVERLFLKYGSTWMLSLLLKKRSVYYTH